jgi:hypothetical protein
MFLRRTKMPVKLNYGTLRTFSGNMEILPELAKQQDGADKVAEYLQRVREACGAQADKNYAFYYYGMNVLEQVRSVNPDAASVLTKRLDEVREEIRPFNFEWPTATTYVLSASTPA